MKVTDYMCVSDIDSAELTVKVAKLLSEGYQPLGGISSGCCQKMIFNGLTQVSEIFIFYSQAMVKYIQPPVRFATRPYEGPEMGESTKTWCQTCLNWHEEGICL